MFDLVAGYKSQEPRDIVAKKDSFEWKKTSRPLRIRGLLHRVA